MGTQIEKMSVASAWSLALKWLCQTAATPCAATVTATGIYDLILSSFHFQFGPFFICDKGEKP